MSQQQEFECEYEREGEFGYGYGYRNEYAQPRNLNMPRCLRGLPRIQLSPPPGGFPSLSLEAMRRSAAAMS